MFVKGRTAMEGLRDNGAGQLSQRPAASTVSAVVIRAAAILRPMDALLAATTEYENVHPGPVTS